MKNLNVTKSQYHLWNKEHCQEHSSRLLNQKRRCWIFSRRRKTRHAFLFSLPVFLPLCISSRPSSLTPDNAALIIAELHRDNRLVESRAVAAMALWENPSCPLQPACRLCTCVSIHCILHRRAQTEDWWLGKEPLISHYILYAAIPTCYDMLCQ